MKTKKIILILFLILSLSFVLTGCSAIGELKTETRINDFGCIINVVKKKM